MVKILLFTHPGPGPPLPCAQVIPVRLMLKCLFFKQYQSISPVVGHTFQAVDEIHAQVEYIERKDAAFKLLSQVDTLMPHEIARF